MSAMPSCRQLQRGWHDHTRGSVCGGRSLDRAAAFETEAELLQVTGHVLALQAAHVHELHASVCASVLLLRFYLPGTNPCHPYHLCIEYRGTHAHVLHAMLCVSASAADACSLLVLLTS